MKQGFDLVAYPSVSVVGCEGKILAELTAKPATSAGFFVNWTYTISFLFHNMEAMMRKQLYFRIFSIISIFSILLAAVGMPTGVAHAASPDTISGNAGVGGATITWNGSGSDSDGSMTADSSGNYSFQVTYSFLGSGMARSHPPRRAIPSRLPAERTTSLPTRPTRTTRPHRSHTPSAAVSGRRGERRPSPTQAARPLRIARVVTPSPSHMAGLARSPLPRQAIPFPRSIGVTPT